MKRVVVLLIAAVALALAATPGARADTDTASKVVKSGQTVRIYQQAYFNYASCATVGTVAVVMIEPPQHGKVSQARGPILVEKQDHPCYGRYLTGTLVFYTAQAGYAGPDSTVFDMVSPDGTFTRVSYALTVVSAGGKAKPQQQKPAPAPGGGGAVPLPPPLSSGHESAD